MMSLFTLVPVPLRSASLVSLKSTVFGPMEKPGQLTVLPTDQNTDTHMGKNVIQPQLDNIIFDPSRKRGKNQTHTSGNDGYLA